jgi:tripartite motif-containing protein 71
VSRFGFGCLAALVIALVTPVSSDAASGTWDRAWGKGVNGGSVFGVCTVAANCLGGTSGPLGGEMTFPLGVATDATGNVYVVDGNRVQKFNSAGTWERAWGKGVNGGGVFGVCTVAASCTGSSSGSLAGEFDFPWGIATDSAGNVYVSDITNNRIQKFGSSGNFLRTWGKDVVSTGPGDSGTGAFEICVPANGDTCKQGTTGGFGGEMNAPQGIATDPSGNVYVADVSNHRIQKFSSAGVWDRTWGRSVTGVAQYGVCGTASMCQPGTVGSKGGEFSTATVGVGTDPSGNVYVADTNNFRIQKFDSSGNFQRTWGKGVNGGGSFEICTVALSCTQGNFSGGLGGTLSGPESVTADASGNVYATEFSNDRISVFDSSGNFLRTWGKNVVGAGPGETGTGFEVCVAANGDTCQQGSPGGLGGEFQIPRGIATDSAGNVYASDNNNNRVQRFADPVPPAQPGPAPPNSSPGPTGQRAAALKKCKKKRGKARAKCKKKAKKLPV